MTLPYDIARCIGQSAGPSGHGLPEQCLHCLRRTAPRAGATFMETPTDAVCPDRLPESRLSPHGSEPWDMAQGGAS